MDNRRNGTSKQNKDKKSGRGKKLTAAERRRIEREKRARYIGDDPLAAFDTDDYSRREPEFTDEFGGIGLADEPIDDNEYSYESDFSAVQRKPAAKRTERRDNNEKSRTSGASAKQRKVRRTLSYISVFLIIVVITVVFSMTVMFRTTEIKVEADNLPYSTEEIITASGLSYNDNIFLAKRKAAEKKLQEKYPYIEGVRVTFRIPGTQIIEIDTAIPSYQVQFSGGFAVVSENSRILEINPKQRNEIPLLKGLKLNQTQPGEYITFEKSSTKQILDEVVKNINENAVSSIYGIDISNTANIELNYDNRITILLGLPEDVGYKLRTAKAIINQSLSAADRGTLDVSLCNSDRRSSYFTPIYSDAVSLPETSTPKVSSSETTSSYDETEYLDDIIE